MKADIGRAVQVEIISYLMTQVLEAPPAKRESLFAAVRSALNVWIVGAACDMRTQTARNASEAGFGGRAREHLARLSRHSPRSAEWIALFRSFKEAFEQEARKALSPESEETGC